MASPYATNDTTHALLVRLAGIEPTLRTWKVPVLTDDTTTAYWWTGWDSDPDSDFARVQFYHCHYPPIVSILEELVVIRLLF
jgi:hypothetical protein